MADGVEPDCLAGVGCPIPALTPRGARALEIHSLLGSLVDLGVGPAVLEVYQADRHDLRLLALIQDTLKPEAKEPGSHGNGP